MAVAVDPYPDGLLDSLGDLNDFPIPSFEFDVVLLCQILCPL
jgi:hypothetical protein